jgi:DNA-binding SARP family transcriptional activator
MDPGLSGGGARRWHLVVGAAGYGKTALLEKLSQTPGAALVSAPAALGGEVAHLLVDDLSNLRTDEQVALVTRLGSMPAREVTLAFRAPPSRAVLAVIGGSAREHGPADLALDEQAVAGILREEYGVHDADLAHRLHDLTGGWPGLVHRVAAVLPERGEDVDALSAAFAEPGSPVASWIKERVIAALPTQARRLLDLVCDGSAPALPVSAELAAAAEVLDASGAEAAFRWLRSTGLVVPMPTGQSRQGSRLWRVVPLVERVYAARRRASRRLDSDRRAARWYREQDLPLAACRMLVRAGLLEEAGELVADQGDAILARGGAADLARMIRDQPELAAAPASRLRYGDALRRSGDPVAAGRVLAPLLAEAERSGAWSAALCWRAAMVHYMRGGYAAALDLADRAPAGTGAGPDNADAVLLRCVRSSTLCMLGEHDQATAEAEGALSEAMGLGDDGVLATALVTAAMSAKGPAQDDLLADALSAAERAGDVAAQARVLLNQAHVLLLTARYRDAHQCAGRAVKAAEHGSPPGILVTALRNAGESSVRLGRLDEAAFCFDRAVRICRRTGLRRAASGLRGLGEVYRQRGLRTHSRAAFEDAIELARLSGEVQVMVPAMASLARELAAGDDTERSRARCLVVEATAQAPPALRAEVEVAAGWVALAEGDQATAGERAALAASYAREWRNAAALAEALELSARVAADPAMASAALTEALAIWEIAGATPAAERVRVELDRMSAAARVRIRVLGGFDVQVCGEPVPLTAWRSRQARTLVKILVARRGRPAARAELCELLWPDDDPSRTGHRLSVLLSVVRGVLDPGRNWPSDHCIRADRRGMLLDLDHVEVDVERLLRSAAAAADLVRAGEGARAREVLESVDAMYAGDAFDDEPYEDWADGLREESRAAWVRSLRLLADLAVSDGEHRRAAALFVRLLAVDPYDEDAHRKLVEALVGAGRHGEARRAFDRWARAMRAIDVDPPDPVVLRSAAPRSRAC